ncbi:MAG: hypothetical protein RJA22_3026 [Verrucomicrobiota bacterium]|jgi:chromosome segregation ATPase
MKATAIILALVAALTSYLFLQRQSALGDAQARLASNEVAQVSLTKQFQTELMLTNLAAGDVRSNLQHTVDVRTAHLNAFSNRLVQANLLLQAAQAETRTAQEETQKLSAQNAVLAARQDDLERRLQSLARLQDDLAASRRETAAALAERDRLSASLQSVRVDMTELAAKLEDPAYLRTQLDRAEESLLLRRKAAAGKLRSNDRRLPLELQADGTVRTLPAPKS